MFSTHRATHNGYAREYATWLSMKNRCYYPGNVEYHCYGGRGIRMCDRWLNSFEAFLEDMGRKPEGMSIDRIDNDGNYEPGNCRWATTLEQSRNRSITVTLSNGEGIADFCERVGAGYNQVYHQYRKGLTAEQIEAKLIDNWCRWNGKNGKEAA